MTTTDKPDHVALLERLGACDDDETDGLPFARRYPTLQAAWDACERGDWQAWYLGRLAADTAPGSPEHRRAVLVACLCARTVTHLIPEPERAEIEGHLSSLEAWAWGDGAVDVRATREALWAIRIRLWRTYAADATAAAAFATAAFAAADAADAYAAARAAADADAAAYAAARREHLAALARLIRAAVPVCPLPG